MGICAARLVETAKDGVDRGRQSGRGIAITEENAGCRVVKVRGFQTKRDGWKSWLGVRASGFDFR